ncbi:MAG: phosphotransferase [Chloroflexia bacterium]|nr:phosphotransferase [Chloroflexia bacterium]
MGNAAELDSINRDKLVPLVRTALGTDTLEIIDWQLVPIHGGGGLGTTIYRVVGTGRDGGKDVDWSIILKIIHAAGEDEEPCDWNHCKREALIYASGMLDDLPAGLSAPRCLGAEDPSLDCSWLWLEDIPHTSKQPWSLSDYATVARQLGRFNGAYLVGEQPLPAYPWLSKEWLRGWTEKSAPAIALFPGILEYPLIRRCFPTSGMADAYLRIWDERADFLHALERLPQVLCHRDAFRRNLFLRPDYTDTDRLVAIDWAFAGPGAVGEELVPLVLAGIAFFEVEPSIMGDLEQVAFEAYVEGLRDAGWQGDPRIVRLGYAASAALRYGPGCAVPALAFLTDPAAQHIASQLFGVTAEEAADRVSLMFTHVLDLADEARQLMDVLPQTASR